MMEPLYEKRQQLKAVTYFYKNPHHRSEWVLNTPLMATGASY